MSNSSISAATTRQRLDHDRSAVAQGRISRRDIAANYLNIRKVLFHPTHTIQNTLRVPMGRIDNQHIHTGLCQQFPNNHGFVRGHTALQILQHIETEKNGIIRPQFFPYGSCDLKSQGRPALDAAPALICP